MKVAILTSTLYGFDGIARVAKLQAEEYAAQGNEVTIFAWAGDLSLDGVRVEILSIPKSPFWRRIYGLLFPLNIFKLREYVTKLKDYDLLIGHEYPLLWLAHLGKKFYNIEYICHIHGSPAYSLYPRFYERAYMRLYHFLWRRSISNADSAIAVSNFLKEELELKYNLDSRVVHNSIDGAVFHPGLDGSSVRNKYALNGSPVVLFVGTLYPHKGVHLLIEAFNIVNRLIPEARLLIVGKPIYSYYLKSLESKASDSVIFAGYIGDEELPGYYAACDIYATASLHENFNIPLVEAQACGKPVVAFDIRSHPEVVQQNTTGFLVKPEDCEQLAEAMISLLKDRSRAQHMGKTAAKWTRETFTI
jgi:glycosyltransferase involved in cell wall biosynthesis